MIAEDGFKSIASVRCSTASFKFPDIDERSLKFGTKFVMHMKE